MNKLNIYINEALAQIKYAKICYAEFEVSLESGDTKNVFFHLHHFVVHVANLDKLLYPSAESKRAKVYASHINLQKIDTKPFRNLRNHLEHFDERLDRWIDNYDGHTFFDNNIITGAAGFPDKAFLRALDGYTYKILGESYELEPLIESLDKLENYLLSIDNTKN